MNGFHHLHLRRRASERAARGLEPFPATTAWKRRLDYLMYGVGIVQPLALIPQALSIYVDHQTAGVSVVTWILLTVFNVLWMFYGIAHKEPPIIIGNILLTLLDLAIVFGVLFY